MATPQLSPGVLVREVDLTVGRADNVLDNIGAIAGPFAIGPVDEATNIFTENELITYFGKPLSADRQYEYWMSASSFLSYGGALKVVRTDGVNLNNANAGIGTSASLELKIKNFDDYQANWRDASPGYAVAAKNPGSWANDLKVCIIDDKADQIISGVATVGIGTTVPSDIEVGYAVEKTLVDVTAVGLGTTSVFNGTLRGIITGVGSSSFDVKVVSLINTDTNEEVKIDYAQKSFDGTRAFKENDELTIKDANGAVVGLVSSTDIKDWYNEQKLEGLENLTIYWSSLAPKPITTGYALERNSRNDGIHVVVIDDTGNVTGIRGNLLEKHLNLSKASDAVSSENSPQRISVKDYVAQNSDHIYLLDNISEEDDATHGIVRAATGFIGGSGYDPIQLTDSLWYKPALDQVFSVVGNITYSLESGQDYSTATGGGGMGATLADLMTSYQLFSNKDEIAVDYLIMGPGLSNKYESQAKASQLISIAQLRSDCVAVISPHRGDVLSGTAVESPITNTNTVTNNLIEFFSSLPSSSYAVFDSGYKYTYDRFNDKFRYLPCNADVAGLMVRTGIFAYPWFSPAGQQRGVLNNAIKLAYNPNKAQRDLLYPERVNAIINQPGVGVVLYGDKTALGYASAFDRINVRRLFLTVEQALERSAQAQLFELNDQITRANFVNIVEPYLRDVQAKRGLYGFLVVCDETNNTPDVIDNNEFRADIYLKPAKSINYVTLTFVATRTGISFEEVAGRV